MRPCSAATPAPGGRAVLVVDAEDPWRPGYVAFMTAFRTALQGATPTPVAIYGENLDLICFESPAYRAALRRWYEAKYGDRRLDAVVAAGPAVLGLLQTWRAELCPDVPLVFVADARTLAQIGQSAGATGVTFELDALGSVRAALALRPDTQRVALVGGTNPYTRGFVTELRTTFADPLEWIDLTGLGMADLRRRVATLPSAPSSCTPRSSATRRARPGWSGGPRTPTRARQPTPEYGGAGTRPRRIALGPPPF